jgi:preprotein translocase subunit SecA
MRPENLASVTPAELEERLVAQAEAVYEQKEKEYGAQNMRILERLVMLRVVDSLWVEHLTVMDDKRKEAGWAPLTQIKAVDAYKNLGGEQWELLKNNITHEVAHTVYHVAVVQQAAPQPGRQAPRQMPKQPPPSPMAQAVPSRSGNQPQSGAQKVGRNDPCPCGSGKKYKHCHGR